MSRGDLLAGYVCLWRQRMVSVLNFFIVLGVYLTTSAAQTADVECFSTDGTQTLLSDQMSDC